MELFVEYAKNVYERTGNMIDVTAAHKPGFRSMYMFNVQDAATIKRSGHSRGFGAYAVISKSVHIDLDGAPVPPNYIKYLRERDISHSVWFSGNKGYHIHVATDLCQSHWLPDWHLSYMQGLGFEFDKSIYRSDMLIRLPKTPHAITGKAKSLISIFQGKNRLTQSELSKNFTEPERRAKPMDLNFAFTLQRLLNTVERGVLPGGRYQTLWSLASNFCALGIRPDSTLDMLTAVNNQFPIPTTPGEVQRAVTQAYGRSNG